jgi:hypothetical protein
VGELHPRLAGVEQTVGGVDVDLVAGAAHVPVDDVRQYREEVAQQGVVAAGLVIGADGLKVPQGGIDGVVFAALRRLPLVGEAIRQLTVGNIVRNSN